MTAACTLIGDSLAVGLAQLMPECQALARVGARSADVLRRLPEVLACGRCVLSIGSNDWTEPDEDAVAALLAVRDRMPGRVLWVLPARGRARAMVLALARARGDLLLQIPQVGPDGVHPTGTAYTLMADRIRGAAW